MLTNAGVFAVVAVNIFTGVGWIILGLLVAWIVRGPWWGLVSIAALGVLAGLFRIEYVDWYWDRTNESSFLKTPEAFILSIFTLVAMFVLCCFLISIVCKKRRFDRSRNT